MDSGVYLLFCDKCKIGYIGETNNFVRREKEHFNKLRKQQFHHNELNICFKSHIYNVDFIIIENVEDLKQRKIREEFYKNNYNKVRLLNKVLDIKGNGKNNPCYGRKLTEEQKEALHNGWRGQPSPKRKLTLEQCFEIKNHLINMYEAPVKNTLEIISETYQTTIKQIDRIRKGDHWSSKELGGSIWDWLKIPKEERRKK